MGLVNVSLYISEESKESLVPTLILPVGSVPLFGVNAQLKFRLLVDMCKYEVRRTTAIGLYKSNILSHCQRNYFLYGIATINVFVGNVICVIFASGGDQ